MAPLSRKKMYEIMQIIALYMKKLLDSDELSAVQFKCSTSAKSITLVQNVQHQCKLYVVILDYDWLKFSKPTISRKMITEVLCGNFIKSLLE